jgi:hypothetical protein
VVLETWHEHADRTQLAYTAWSSAEFPKTSTVSDADGANTESVSAILSSSGDCCVE